MYNEFFGVGMASPAQITQLLESVGKGSTQAVDDLFPLVYDELRKIAAAYLQRERRDHTLQTTALVHEAYLRLIGQKSAGWGNRIQFFGVAAKVMRRILVDRARTRHAVKRGGNAHRIELDEAVASFEERAIDLVALDEALERLAELDPRKSDVVEMRFFGGMSLPEIAELLKTPLRTIERDWTTARAWLRAEISR